MKLRLEDLWPRGLRKNANDTRRVVKKIGGGGGGYWGFLLRESDPIFKRAACPINNDTMLTLVETKMLKISEGSSGEGAMGAKPPLDQRNLLILRGAEPPWKKNLSLPWTNS